VFFCGGEEAVVMVEDLGCGCWAGEKVGGFVEKASEGGKDIFNVVSFDAVKQEIRRVKLGHKVEAFTLWMSPRPSLTAASIRQPFISPRRSTMRL